MILYASEFGLATRCKLRRQTTNSAVSLPFMSEYSHDTIVPFPDSKKKKKNQIADMFNQIAFRYDFMNHFLSGGLDLYWRRQAIKELQESHPNTVLDVATGTGDMAILVARTFQTNKIIGIDISEGMLNLGQKKIDKLGFSHRVQLHLGDGETINFPDNTFQAITIAFGVRNFENLEKGLAEMLRVLRPGGKLVILEFSKPKRSFFRALYHLYLRVIAPKIGRFVSHNRAAYQYLNESVQAFPQGEELLRILLKSGYRETYKKGLSMGICTIYCGTKLSV
jgi:demethylmenaquinone methyltransferase/2-methoxy-6-polyprenyl-1,4-benzoquinol methylase